MDAVALTGFLLAHRAMRAGAHTLVTVLARPLDAAELGVVARWFDRFQTVCAVHAEGEDFVLWPALCEVRRDLDDVMSRMDRQHEELDSALERTAHALREGCIEEARALATQVAVLVDDHLDGEERDVVPALVAAFPEARLAELMRAVQEGAGPAGSAVALPFLLEHATAEEAAGILGALPAAVREAYATEWQPAYAALRDPFAALATG